MWHYLAGVILLSRMSDVISVGEKLLKVCNGVYNIYSFVSSSPVSHSKNHNYNFTHTYYITESTERADDVELVDILEVNDNINNNFTETTRWIMVKDTTQSDVQELTPHN